MSPFLFILMAEGLSCLIAAQKGRGEIRGVKAHEGAPPQTDQQFVDDTMLMGHPSVQEARSFKNSFGLFSRALGLVVNHNKSQVFFVNTPSATQRNILRVLGFARGDFPSKYLGIPLGMGSLQQESWQELLDKLNKKFSS